MATDESNIVQDCRIAASKGGARVFRNNRGFFVTIDCIEKIRKAVMQPNPVKAVMETLKTLRRVRAGLEVPGSSDLIGWHTITVTPEMVGKQIAVFTAPEVKRPGQYPSPDQRKFITNVQEAGGIAGVVHSGDEMALLLKTYKPK